MEAIRIGDQGDRVVVSARVLATERIEGEWGNGTLIKMQTPDGAYVYWRASNGDLLHTLKVGDPITVRATIDRYKVIADVLWCRITRGTIDEGALALV